MLGVYLIASAPLPTILAQYLWVDHHHCLMRYSWQSCKRAYFDRPCCWKDAIRRLIYHAHVYVITCKKLHWIGLIYNSSINPSLRHEDVSLFMHLHYHHHHRCWASTTERWTKRRTRSWETTPEKEEDRMQYSLQLLEPIASSLPPLYPCNLYPIDSWHHRLISPPEDQGLS